ncbi:hypothetical protein GOBAR_AA21599 [Gossypium barbadense]|uniref:MATH domain-containing protein n=1 Tax=Gossypium barbadense TaxID=3634 RepID=A0A2P5X6W0_GOSBA|nr:hypothetical protein GOBAR_AA21599 [Gossypium barbadense]
MEIRRATREVPPAHYIFSIESFSLLVATGVEKYESHAFDVQDYKWRLSLYPNGNKRSNGEGFISLYLQIEDTQNFPRTWEVNVNFRFFILDQIRDKYLTIESDGVVKRFYQMKTEWGIAQLLSLDHFNKASNGYLVGDCCTFGVEVFVIEQTGKLERLSMMKGPPNNTITFQLQNYSKSLADFYTSGVQTIGDSKWELIVYPRGMGIAKLLRKGSIRELRYDYNNMLDEPLRTFTQRALQDIMSKTYGQDLLSKLRTPFKPIH